MWKQEKVPECPHIYEADLAKKVTHSRQDLQDAIWRGFSIGKVLRDARDKGKSVLKVDLR